MLQYTETHYTNYTTSQLQLTTTTPLHYSYNYAYNYNFNCTTPHYIQQLWWGDHCNHCNHSRKHNSKHLSVHQWIRSSIRESQQPTSPIDFLFLKLPPPPCAVLLVFTVIYHLPLFEQFWCEPSIFFCSGDSLNPKTSNIASLCSCAPKAQHHLHPTAARCWTPVANLLLHTVASHGVSACVVVSLFSAQKLSLADLGSCGKVQLGVEISIFKNPTTNLTISAYYLGFKYLVVNLGCLSQEIPAALTVIVWTNRGLPQALSGWVGVHPIHVRNKALGS